MNTDYEVLEVIRSGEAVAFVGSGPSCEMGLPSWPKLVEVAIEAVRPSLAAEDVGHLAKLRDANDYPALLDICAEALGGPEPLCRLLEPHFTARATSPPQLYPLLAKWPFRFYMTTNFDNQLLGFIRDEGRPGFLLQNTKEDMRKIDNQCRDVVLSVHGDFAHPSDIVLTKTQYMAFAHSPDREYWRFKMQAIFTMFRVVVFGYSMNDPDILAVLGLLQNYGSPDRPVYIYMANVPRVEAAQKWKHYNIRVIPYLDDDHSHRRLLSALKSVSLFIPSRTAQPARRLQSHADASAVPLYLYTKTVLSEPQLQLPVGAYASLILSAFTSMSAGGEQPVEKVVQTFPFSTTGQDVLRNEFFLQALSWLKAKGYCRVADDNTVSLTSSGEDMREANAGTWSLLKDQVLDSVCEEFRRLYPTIAPDVASELATRFLESVVAAYEKRGATYAGVVVRQAQAIWHDDVELFRIVSQAFADRPELSERSFWIDRVRRFLYQPTEQERQLSWHLAQGYFGYHCLGLDPGCAQFRLDHLRAHTWLLDSSVVIPLFAMGCASHPYAVDLFQKIKALGLTCIVTGRVFDEIVLHSEWPEKTVTRGSESADLEFLRVAMAQGGYRQNLFVDGFICTAVQRGELTYADFIREVFGAKPRAVAIEERLLDFGVEVVSLDHWPGFDQVDWSDFNELTARIREARIARGHYKSEDQCEAEAEVILILKNENAGRYSISTYESGRAVFVSQSLGLRQADDAVTDCIWSPAGFYQQLIGFEGREDAPDLLSRCMLGGAFNVGIRVIDEAAYRKFFGNLIAEADLTMKTEAATFDKAFERQAGNSIVDEYEGTNELERPFFASNVQAALDRLRHEEIERGIRDLESQKKALEERKREVKLDEKERHEFDRLLGRSQERRSKAAQRKRAATSSRRKKKKKKKR